MKHSDGIVSHTGRRRTSPRQQIKAHDPLLLTAVTAVLLINVLIAPAALILFGWPS